MRLKKSCLSACCALGLLGGAAIAADEPAATQPTTKPARGAARASAIRVVQPWSKVADLTDEQKQKLDAIHDEMTAKINALREQEKALCEAVLSEEQRKQLAETLAVEAAERKAKAGKKTDEPAPAQ